MVTGRKDARDELAKMVGLKPLGETPAKKEPVDPIRELEELISSVENIDKKELLQAKLRQLTADLALRARESENRARQYDAKGKEGGEKLPEEDKWTIFAGKPTRDPEGEYTFSQALKVASLESQKDTKTDTKPDTGILGVLKFMKDEGLLGNSGNKEADPLTTQLIQKAIDHTYGENAGKSPEMELLRTELKELRQQVALANDPLAAARKVKELYQGFEEAGLITKGNVGKSIEETKEENRHAEEVEKQKAERDYNDKKVSILADLPDRISSGLAGRILESEGTTPAAARTQSTQMEYMKCTGENDGKPCDFNIPIPPGAGTKIQCPKCGAVYERKLKE